jgi:hypothetical protein
MRIPKIGAAATVSLLLMAVTAVSATGLTVKKADGLTTSPPRANITGVTYTNREAAVVTTVAFEDLDRQGTVKVVIGIPNSDVGYQATVTRSRNGTMDKKFQLFTPVSSRATCTFAVRWSQSREQVRVTVPQSCLKFGDFPTHYYMRASSVVVGVHDGAPWAIVGRGDSPGCVTRAEITKLHKGMRIAHVHAILDTDGRANGGGGGFSRLYRSCSGGSLWDIEYTSYSTLAGIYR